MSAARTEPGSGHGQRQANTPAGSSTRPALRDREPHVGVTGSGADLSGLLATGGEGLEKGDIPRSVHPGMFPAVVCVE